MTEWDFVWAIVEKVGLPGTVVMVFAWAVYRFGATPAPRPERIEPTTAPALEKLGAKIDAMKEEMTDRLARVETEIANIKGRRQ